MAAPLTEAASASSDTESMANLQGSKTDQPTGSVRFYGLVSAALRSFAATEVGCVWIALNLFHFLYRARLIHAVYHVPPGDPPILGFIPGMSSRLDLLSCLFLDFSVVTMVTMVIGAFMYSPLLARGLVPAAASPWVRHAIAVVGLALVSLVTCLHFSLLWFLQTAPTRSLLVAAARQEFSLSWYADYVSAPDIALLASGLLFYVAARWTARRAGPLFVAALLVLGILSVPLYILRMREKSARDALLNAVLDGAAAGSLTTRFVPEEIRANPVRWFAKWVVWAPAGSIVKSESGPGLEQQRTVGFVDPAFVVDRKVVPSIPRPDARPWNVVFVLIESLSAKTMDLEGGRYLPNLKRLASEGLSLGAHYSAGVDTDYAAFSLFTGLYPMPEAIQYVDRSDLHVPTVFSSLNGHPSLLVSPSDLRLWFPLAMLRNSGLSDIWDASSVPARTHDVVMWNVKDETETASFFLERLGGLKEPFVAMYYAYATHSPYFVQDDAKMSPEAGRRERYLHNATLVDVQIGRIVEKLGAAQLSDRTILVLLADHGEAFGEHTGNFGHGLFLFDESVRVPAIFYQPKLFQPRRITDVTSHVDVLPTVLDAMGVPFDPLSFEGESVLQDLKRKYVFMYSPKAEQLASVSRDGVKVIIDYAHDSCEAYDTRADPGETRPSRCDQYLGQRKDLGVYHQYQQRLLEEYIGARHALPPAPSPEASAAATTGGTRILGKVTP